MDAEVEHALARIRCGTSPHKLESQTLDFKAASSTTKDTLANVAEAAVCFANATGGRIVLGVADRAQGAAALVGTDVAATVVRARPT